MSDYQERHEALVADWNQLQAMCQDKRGELDRLRQQIKGYEEVHWKLRPLLNALEEIMPK